MVLPANIAMPTSAFLMAKESLIPSPTMAAYLLLFWKTLIILSFCSGRTLAKIVVLSTVS